MAGRVFDAVAGGAAGVYFKTLVAPPDQPSPTAVVFAENAEYLVPNTPDLTVAALMPNSALALDPAVINQMVVHTQVLRTAFEFEFIDENMIADGMLPRFKALLVTAGDTVEQPVLDAIGAWVEQGGVLVAAGDAAPLRNVRGETAAWWPAMEAGASAGYAVASRGAGFVVEVGGAWPEWRDQVIGLVHEEDMAPWDGPLAEPIDGVCDNVLATRVGNRVFYLNNSDDPATFQAADGAAYDIEPRAIVTVRAPK
jgi:hypothetical protein